MIGSDSEFPDETEEERASREFLQLQLSNQARDESAALRHVKIHDFFPKKIGGARRPVTPAQQSGTQQIDTFQRINVGGSEREDEEDETEY